MEVNMFEHVLSAGPARRAGVVAVLALSLGVALQPGISAQDRQSAAPDAVASRQDRNVNVDVNSSNWMDAHVYMVRDGLATSLGVVSGPGKAVLTLPSIAVTPGVRLQLMVLPIGTRGSYLSEPFAVDPGDVVDLQIENNLALSHVTIAPRA
jgi:hypothetical protein